MASIDQTERSTTMKGLIERVARAVVNDPESVVVLEIQEGEVTTFKLRVDPDDMGRVIGKRGRVANAMRTLLRVAAGLEGRRVKLDIEPLERNREERMDSMFDDE